MYYCNCTHTDENCKNMLVLESILICNKATFFFVFSVITIKAALYIVLVEIYFRRKDLSLVWYINY